MRLALIFIFLSLFLLTACGGAEQVASEPTLTLAPIVSLTPRSTATPIPTRTPTPTLTYTPSLSPIPPSPTTSPTPTEPPPIEGVIQSLQDVNVRSGPGASFDPITALVPGTGVEVLGVSSDGSWYNVVMEDGREGWVSATLVFVRPSATPFPSITPTPDLTQRAQSGQPTSVIGGNVITPTPPQAITTLTPPGTPAPVTPTAPPGIVVPTINTGQINTDAIGQTATALAGGAGAVAATPRPAGGPTGGPLPLATTPAPPPPAGTVVVGQAVDVFALCDNPAFRLPPPANLATGTTIDIYFAWFAATRQQVEDHVANAIYEVRLDGVQLTVGQPQFIRARNQGGYEAYWYLQAGPLTAGQRVITYRVTWRAAVFDGTASFGPGTGIPEERGSCTFTVR
ncbi:MAG: SH3 domain-containing protein [Chloroflexota bacterium]|nr:SH3 domain-containing protein [Chloroflexota bacterium]